MPTSNDRYTEPCETMICHNPLECFSRIEYVRGVSAETDVDALVQAGTNLSMVSLADEAERWLGKPVLAINAATWWMALRENGIHDKVYGCGRLLREF